MKKVSSLWQEKKKIGEIKPYNLSTEHELKLEPEKSTCQTNAIRANEIFLGTLRLHICFKRFIKTNTK